MLANFAPLAKLGLSLYSPADGTRPVAAAFGTSVTPAQNAYGSYAQLLAGASVTEDCYVVEIVVSGVGISAAARDCIVKIGLDRSGGSSYTDTTIDLCCGSASNFGNANPGGGVGFRFYLYVPAGCSVGAAASVNSATLTAIGVTLILRGRPQKMERQPCGQFIDSYGTTPASSSGTAVTFGTASEGAWTQLGTITRRGWYLEFGFGINDAVQSNNTYLIDIGVGDASNKLVVIANAPVITSSVEMVNKPISGVFGDFQVNDVIYARGQCGPNAASAAASIAAYLVGG